MVWQIDPKILKRKQMKKATVVYLVPYEHEAHFEVFYTHR